MDSKWERVQPYFNINNSLAEKMMSYIKPHEKVKKTSLIKKGLRNSNYCIDYDDNKFLLRIYGTGDDWWEKERAVFDHIKGRVNVPELLYFNDELNIIDKPYAVFEYITGPALDEYFQQKVYNENVISEIGKSLAMVHETPYNEVGFFDDNLNVATKLPSLELWYDMFLKDNTAKKLEKKLTEDVRNYIKRNNENIRRIEEKIAFVHNDFRPINIIIDKDERPYFIDWEGAMAGHILGDIGQFLRIEEQVNMKNEKIFINNYNYHSKNKLPDDYKELVKLRDLVNLVQMLNSEYDLYNKDRDLIELIRNTCYERNSAQHIYK